MKKKEKEANRVEEYNEKLTGINGGGFPFFRR